MNHSDTTAIIGLGNMGRGLARRLSGRGELIVAARDIDAATAFAATLDGARAASVEEAMGAADLIVLALPYDAARELAGTTPEGRVLVDISNPVTPDFSGLSVGHVTSAAEQIRAAAGGAPVVKAFNTVFAELFDAPREATGSVPVFLAGDEGWALERVAALVERAGFAVERAGALEAARLLEPLGMLNIRFGYALGRGTAIAPAWLAVAA